jgi:hypothetical protein
VDEDDAADLRTDGPAEQLSDPNQRSRAVARVGRHDPYDEVLRVLEVDPQLLPRDSTSIGQLADVADAPTEARRVVGAKPSGRGPNPPR